MPRPKVTKPPKVWTPKQIARLATQGYYFTYYGLPETAPVGFDLIYIGTGKCQYNRHNPSSATGVWGWCTLLWSCAPTRKQIAAENPTGKEYHYVYFKEFSDLLSAWSTIAPTYSVITKAPADI